MRKAIGQILIVSAIIMSNGCASMLNGRYQNVEVFTGSSESTVYVNDAKQGTGTVVKTKMKRDFNPRLVKVERPGYKPVYAVHRQSKKSWLHLFSWIPFGPIYLFLRNGDNGPKSFDYEKSMVLQVERKVFKKDSTHKFMVLKKVNFDGNEEDYTVERINYKRLKKGLKSKSNHQSKYKGAVSIDNSNFSDDLNTVLYEAGYVDTSGVILKSKLNSTYVVARVKNFNFTYVELFKGSYSLSLICLATIDWEFQDKYEQIKFKITKTAKSGEFCTYKPEAGSSSERTASFLITVQDAISNSFYDVMSDPLALEFLKSSEVNPNLALGTLNISKGRLVSEMKSGVEATTVILTNKGHGSGCVVGKDGYIVTSLHVVAGVDSTIKVAFNDGDTAVATIVRTSEMADLALLKVNKTCNYAFNVTTTPDFEVADEVFAIGTPASVELGQTVSKGIISATRKEVGGLELIQTDVSVNPGNSGGPIMKRNGTFIGVVNAKISGKGLEGLGFCTPAEQIINELNIDFK